MSKVEKKEIIVELSLHKKWNKPSGLLHQDFSFDILDEFKVSKDYEELELSNSRTKFKLRLKIKKNLRKKKKYKP